MTLDPLQGDPRPLEDWVTTFHLVFVVLDPYTYESSWLIDTAGRILSSFNGADVRPSWVVTANKDDVRGFLGPWSDTLLTFADPDRQVVRALGLERLPAIVHLNQGLQVVASAEGWHPDQWREVTDNLASLMRWSRPAVPAAGDPVPYDGTPALG